MDKITTTLWIYLQRWLRIVPVLAFIVVLRITIWKFMASGPNHQQLMWTEKRTCERFWWITLLLVDNFSSAKVNLPPLGAHGVHPRPELWS